MSTLDWITVEGFKSIKSIEELELRPINVLIGANGAGKSNFLEVFSFLKAIRLGGLQDYVKKAGGADRILHFGSKTTEKLRIHVSFENQARAYIIDLGPGAADRIYSSTEMIFNRAGPGPSAIRVEGRDGEAGVYNSTERSTGISAVRKHLLHWQVYHFHDTSATSPIKKTVALNDNRCLRHDGSNLAAFLYYLREIHGRSYDMIRRTVQHIAPFFDEFHLEPLALNENTIWLEWRHRGSDDYFDAASLSDGTLRFIALATLLLQPKELRPSVILLDEPELGLHPAAIAILASLIKQVSTETQVIVGTQSPIFLDHFEPDDVLVTERAEGATRFTRLEREKLKIWLEDYSLGQLWERNELGGLPKPERTELETAQRPRCSFSW